MAELLREQVVGQTLVGIAHSRYSTPEFIVEGIGPAAFRSHFLSLSNGLVIDLFVFEITLSSIPTDSMECETKGLTPDDLFGRRIEAVVKDDTNWVLVVLEGGIFLWDGNDAFYGNPLWAGDYSEFEKWCSYKSDGQIKIVDYWTNAPMTLTS